MSHRRVWFAVDIDRAGSAWGILRVWPGRADAVAFTPSLEVRVRVSIGMFLVVALLAIALGLMAVTESPVPGWVAVACLFLWMVGRVILGVGGPSDDNVDADR